MPHPASTVRTGPLAVVVAALLLTVALAAPAAARDRGDVVGQGPLADVTAAAAAHQRCAQLSVDELVAMVFAPTWPETGANPDHAPSPLVFSRWDDHVNFYSFDDRSSMERAFWHPGVGMWQMDSAGGWPYNAAQRVDTGVAGPVVVDTMAKRYCARSTHVEGLKYAWGPWYGCGPSDTRFQACKATYDNLLARLGDDSLVVDSKVGSRKGLTRTSCRHTVDGSNRVVDCWVVDTTDANTSNPPVPLQLQAELGEDASAVQTPLSRTFTTYTLDGREWRQWARSDTGYGVDIHAWRPITANARGNITWGTGLAAQVGGVGPTTPNEPLSDLLLFRNADRRVVSLDVGSGGAQWTMWWTNWKRQWTDIVAADLDADGDEDDVLLYNADTGAWSMQAFSGGTPRGIATGTWWTGWDVTAGDFDGNGVVDDLLLSRGDRRRNVTHVTTGGRTERLSATYWDRDWTDFRAADLDGDGLLDDVLAYDAASGNFSMERVVDGVPRTLRSGRWWSGWDGLVFGDFDGNGRVNDLFLFRNDGLRFNVTTVQSDGATSPRHVGYWKRSWTHFAGADLDEDGTVDDVLIYNDGTGDWSMQRITTGAPRGIDWGDDWSPGWEFVVPATLR